MTVKTTVVQCGNKPTAEMWYANIASQTEMLNGLRAFAKGRMKTKSTYTYMLGGWRTRSDIPLTSVAQIVCDNERVDIAIQIAHGRSPIVKTAGPL